MDCEEHAWTISYLRSMEQNEKTSIGPPGSNQFLKGQPRVWTSRGYGYLPLKKLGGTVGAAATIVGKEGVHQSGAAGKLSHTSWVVVLGRTFTRRIFEQDLPESGCLVRLCTVADIPGGLEWGLEWGWVDLPAAGTHALYIRTDPSGHFCMPRSLFFFLYKRSLLATNIPSVCSAFPQQVFVPSSEQLPEHHQFL